MKLNKILMIAALAITTTGMVERIYAQQIWATFDEKRLIDIWNGNAEEASTYGKGVKVIKIDRARLEADGLEMKSGSIVEKSTGRVVKGINIYGEGKVTYEVAPEKGKTSTRTTKITLKDRNGNQRSFDFKFTWNGDLNTPEAEAAFKAALNEALFKHGLVIFNGDIVDAKDTTIKYGNFEDFYHAQLAKARARLKNKNNDGGGERGEDGGDRVSNSSESGIDGRNDIDDMYDYSKTTRTTSTKKAPNKKDRSETGIDSEGSDSDSDGDSGVDADNSNRPGSKSTIRVTSNSGNDIDDMYDYSKTTRTTSNKKTKTPRDSGDEGFDSSDDSDSNPNRKTRSSNSTLKIEWSGKSGLGDSDLSDFDLLLKHRKPSSFNAQAILEYLDSGDRSLADIKAKLRELYPNADADFIDALAKRLFDSYFSVEIEESNVPSRNNRSTTRTTRSSSSGDDAYMRSLLGDDYDLVFGPGDFSISISESNVSSGLDDIGINWSDAQKQRLSRLILKIINSGDAGDLDSIKAKLRDETGITDDNQIDQLARLIIKLQNGKGPRKDSQSDISIDDQNSDAPNTQVKPSPRRSNEGSASSISINTTSGNGYSIIAERDWGANGLRLQVQKPSGGFEFLQITVNEKGESVAKDSAGNEYVKVNGNWGFKNAKVIVGPSVEPVSPEEKASIETLEILIKSGLNQTAIEMILPGYKPQGGNYRGLYGTSGSGKMFYQEFQNKVPVNDPAKVREEVDNLLKN
ncbi:MAG: hypothetical protein J0L93_04120 [Deltaproteobacteria bacterium]|nr:hypothetical protein [Deltaproteobacteria bacterium]